MPYTVVTSDRTDDCGHAHRTREAAERCQSRLSNWHCDYCGGRSQYTFRCRHHNWVGSAKWGRSSIHATGVDSEN